MVQSRGRTGRAHALITLDALARDFGLIRTYRDGFGRLVTADVESVLAVLAALGLEVSTESIEQTRRFAWATRAAQGLSEVSVAWDGALSLLTGTFAADDAVEGFRFTIKLESGAEVHGHATLHESAPCGPALMAKRCTFRTPLILPLGYHELYVEGSDTPRVVIAAPQTQPRPRGRELGLFAPVHSLRGSTHQGVGTFTDLRELCQFAHAHGAQFVGVLPTLSAFLDHPFDPSPFAPASKLFWNEALLDICALEELAQCRDVQEKLARVQPHASKHDASPSYVSFRERSRILHEVLAKLSRVWAEANGANSTAMQALRKTSPDVDRYAHFRALTERHGPTSSWDAQTRRAFRDGPSEHSECSTRHLYAQLKCEAQLESVSPLPTKLYMDLPLGAHSESYDVAAYPDCFLPSVCVGAPPDKLSPKGQNWGFFAMSPEGQARDHYRYFARTVRTQLRHARMLRIDHVMGLHRVFVIPRGAQTSDGLYLRQPHEELYAVLNLESHRAQALCIGEDLGVVPDEVRSSLKRHGLLRMSVLPFEVHGVTALASDHSFEDALATLNTHDMPTFAASWESAQATPMRSALALDAQVEPSEGLKITSELLARSDAPFVQLALEDLWGETEPVNVPGVFAPERSFCRRMGRSIAEIAQDEEVTSSLHRLSALRKQAVEPETL